MLLFSSLSFSLKRVWTDWQMFFWMCPVCCCCKHVWSLPDVLHWSADKSLCLHSKISGMWEQGIPCALEINSNDGLSESMWNLVLQLLKISYLHHHNIYGHKAWHSSDLTWGAPTYKVTWNFDLIFLQNHVKN